MCADTQRALPIESQFFLNRKNNTLVHIVIWLKIVKNLSNVLRRNRKDELWNIIAIAYIMAWNEIFEFQNLNWSIWFWLTMDSRQWTVDIRTIKSELNLKQKCG